VAVDVQLLAEVADLVRETTFKACQVFARVLRHLRDADAGADERRIHRLIQRDRAAGVGRVVVADEVSRVAAEVPERRPFAQELRVDRYAEAFAVTSCPTFARAPG